MNKAFIQFLAPFLASALPAQARHCSRLIESVFFLFIACLVMTACSKDDAPKHVSPERIVGEWYITNVSGWEYRDDAHNSKSEFNETFNFNGQGIPVDNIADAQKVRFTEAGVDTQLGIYYLEITSYYWDLSYRDWVVNQQGTVKLQGNQLVDGTMKVSITKLTDTTMTTYRKDRDGETFITYTRL